MMPRFEMRFHRTRDNRTQSVSFEAPSVQDALALLPRHPEINDSALWCDGRLLFHLARAEAECRSFWIISPDQRQGQG